MKRIMRGTKKVVVGLLGFVVVILGLILIPLPGPGILICILGFAILASEFNWAQRWLDQAKDKLEKATAPARAKFKESLDDLSKDDKK